MLARCTLKQYLFVSGKFDFGVKNCSFILAMMAKLLLPEKIVTLSYMQTHSLHN